jgi:hypothetical protein
VYQLEPNYTDLMDGCCDVGCGHLLLVSIMVMLLDVILVSQRVMSMVVPLRASATSCFIVLRTSPFLVLSWEACTAGENKYVLEILRSWRQYSPYGAVGRLLYVPSVRTSFTSRFGRDANVASCFLNKSFAAAAVDTTRHGFSPAN